MQRRNGAKAGVVADEAAPACINCEHRKKLAWGLNLGLPALGFPGVVRKPVFGAAAYGRGSTAFPVSIGLPIFGLVSAS